MDSTLVPVYVGGLALRSILESSRAASGQKRTPDREHTPCVTTSLFKNIVAHTLLGLLTMSGEKRPAANSFGSTQLVKRAKSDATAVAVVNGTAHNGALIQAVCTQYSIATRSQAMLTSVKGVPY
jgi:hypothetical protein